ncbi:MAG: hypothetical protein HYU41_04085 [Candidatus Rokubacteria bacterium]|nr:hypothetical protein [Candidatus Rokubacteria bacterium]
MGINGSNALGQRIDGNRIETQKRDEIKDKRLDVSAPWRHDARMAEKKVIVRKTAPSASRPTRRRTSFKEWLRSMPDVGTDGDFARIRPRRRN